MIAEEFRRLAEELTGTPVKDVSPTDDDILNRLLADDDLEIEHSDFNELLLLVNKDRTERAFFEHFFGPRPRVSELRKGVTQFQEIAMLCYGNFIHAYRTLSRIDTTHALRTEIGEWARKSQEIENDFRRRSDKRIDTETISRSETPLVGYLSAGEIVAEHERATFLKSVLDSERASLAALGWDECKAKVISNAAPEGRPALESVLENFRARNPDAKVADFASHLDTVLPMLEAREQTLDEVRRKAIRNQDVYLTWDHMDVYFATSMRKRWEYEDLYDFVGKLMAREELTDLKLRHFDPTQAYTANRVNKGLVEALMLKRARCTVYSVQDTDTLGKDSELAATLAQGKPVIAYVPDVPVDDRHQQLLLEDPVTVHDRLRFVIYADEQFSQSLEAGDWEFLQSFTKLEEYARGRIWRSIPDTNAIDELRAAHNDEIDRVCRIVACSEKRI